MPLNEIVDNLDGIDEKYHDLYIENSDGKFEVNIDGLKSALNKERQLKKELEKKLKTNDSGDPDINELREELKTAKNAITNMEINGKIRNAAVSAGVDPDYVEDVIQLTKNNFTIGDNGNVINIDVDGNQTQKTVDHFFKNDFKRSKPRFFLNSGRKGGGAHDGDVIPLSLEGKLDKAIKGKDVKTMIQLKQNKIIK